jgi:hypothetical protein
MYYYYFFIRIRGGEESKLGTLGTSATEWPIVPAPGDCDDGKFYGMKIGRRNRSTRRKPAPAPLSLPQIPLAIPGLENPGRRGGKPATNRLSYGAALALWICVLGHALETKYNQKSLLFVGCDLLPPHWCSTICSSHYCNPLLLWSHHWRSWVSPFCVIT